MVNEGGSAARIVNYADSTKKEYTNEGWIEGARKGWPESTRQKKQNGRSIWKSGKKQRDNDKSECKKQTNITPVKIATTQKQTGKPAPFGSEN